MSRERRESQKCGLRLFLSGKEVRQNGTGLSCRTKQEFYGNEQPSFQEQRFVIKGKGTAISDVKSARGLELQMQGLASLSRDGIDSVRSAIKELEYYGYVERNMIRNEYGLFTDKEYIIWEIPIGQENDVIEYEL